ncbi:tyrosine recombinase XerC, partial [Escherichia coli]|nr:tyrosine recombinase XerC [Escherichia coli]
MGKKSLSTLEAQHLRSYLLFLKTQKKASSTIARKISSIRSFLKFLSKHKKIPHNLFLYLSTPKLSKKIPLVPTEEEIERFISFLEEEKKFFKLR